MLVVPSAIEIAAAANLSEIRPPANEDRHEPNMGPPLRAIYHQLKAQIIRERDAGNLVAALRLCDQGISVATQLDDEAIIDQAYCNRCGFAVVLGETGVSTARLREILMRNHSARTSFTAAYVLSYIYAAERNYKKALFYAQISHHRAQAIGETGLLVQSHNELGRSYLAESHFVKAVTECEAALRILPAEMSYLHLAPMINLGYTKLLLKDYKSGFQYLYRCLRHCRSNPSEKAYQEWIHLYLSFGHTESSRWRYAWHHAQEALALAQKNKNSDVLKNSLYLLGEIEKAAGDFEAAHDTFLRLQREFYPDNKELVKMMLYYDTRDLVNLMRA